MEYKGYCDAYLFLVPDSPDLATHVRSLRGTVFEQSTSPLQDISQISSVDNDRDEILEDTGGEYIEKSCKRKGKCYISSL